VDDGKVRECICICGLFILPPKVRRNRLKKGKRNMKTTTFRIVLLALFIALCAVGANIKIMGSIAFDSLPAFLAAMLIGGKEGAIAGAAGHLFSALLAGFPLTLPMHLAVAASDHTHRQAGTTILSIWARPLSITDCGSAA
jgi:hypothetical protein